AAAPRYCLPPVLMTANIVLVLVFDPGARNEIPDRLLPVATWLVSWLTCVAPDAASGRRNTNGAGTPAPAAGTIETRRSESRRKPVPRWPAEAWRVWPPGLSVARLGPRVGP